MKLLMKVKELTNGVFQDNKVVFMEKEFTFVAKKSNDVHVLSWENTENSSNLLENLLDSRNGFHYDNNNDEYFVEFRDISSFNLAQEILIEIAKRNKKSYGLSV